MASASTSSRGFTPATSRVCDAQPNSTCSRRAGATSSASASARSRLNNCTYCLNLHYEAAREAGIPRAKIDTLTAWWETELHSEAEQAALRYTEALTRAADTDRDAAFQRFHDALAENFSPEEILEIVAVVVNMNVWTRIKLAEGAMPGAA
jgi:AhpD family alkylhydroperoxidase